MPKRYIVCPAAELPAGGRKIIETDRFSVGVFNVHGTYHALRNSCPHQKAPLCLGRVTGTTPPGAVGEYGWERDGQIVRCPWHGWEFDITDGKSVFNPHKVRVRSYEVTVETADGQDCKQTLSSDEPDPQVTTFPVQTEDGLVCVYV